MALIYRVFLSLLLFFAFFAQTAQSWLISDPPVSYGTFVTEFNYGQMVVDDQGNLYIAGADHNDGGVAKYDSDGNLLYYFGPTSPGAAIGPDGSVYLTNWDSEFGNTPGVFKYDGDGNAIDISSTDLGSSIFIFSYGIAVNSVGNVYVTDIQGNGDADFVLVFDAAGEQIGMITGNGGDFNQPQAVAVDGDDNIYVLDSGNNRVQKFSSDGSFLLEITGNGGAWSYPEGFDVDSHGNVYVSDSGKERVQIFNSVGVFQQELDAADFGIGSFDYLVGITLNDENGTLYVGNYSNILVANFDRSPAVITSSTLPGDITDDKTPIFTGTATDDSVIISVEFSIDGGDFEACTPDDGAFDGQEEAYTCSITTPLTLGEHTIVIRSTDDLGNINEGEALLSYTFTVVASTSEDDGEEVGGIGRSSNNNSKSGNITSSGRGTTFVCRDEAPNEAPDLFQIDVKNNSAKLFFTPLANTDKYFISFSTDPSAEEHGEEVSLAREGVQSHAVYYLKPNTKYYFKVRGQKGCMPGEWSNVMEVKSRSRGLMGVVNYYKNLIIKPASKISNQAVESQMAVKAEDLNQASEISSTPSPTARPTKVIEKVSSPTPTSAPIPAPIDNQPEKKKFCFLWWCL